MQAGVQTLPAWELRYDSCPRACAPRFTLGHNLAGFQPLGEAAGLRHSPLSRALAAGIRQVDYIFPVVIIRLPFIYAADHP